MALGDTTDYCEKDRNNRPTRLDVYEIKDMPEGPILVRTQRALSTAVSARAPKGGTQARRAGQR